MSNNKKSLSVLGLARRAGKISMGHDTAAKAVREKKAKLLMFTSDASDGLIGEFSRISEKYYPELISVSLKETMDEIHFVLGYKAAVITVNDENFSNRILQLIQEEDAYGNKG